MLGFFTMLILNSAAAFAADPSTPPPVATIETTKDLDARINSLQSTKDCIHSAKSKADIERCRLSIEIKRERINVH